MFSFVNIPAKILAILELDVSPAQIAGGFMESLMGLVKPNAKTVEKIVKKEGIKALNNWLSKKAAGPTEGTGGTGTNADTADSTENSSAKDAVSSLQSLFGGKKESDK